MAGSSLVRWEVSGAMPGLPGLTPHAYIPIDSNTGHVRVRVETEADKDSLLRSTVRLSAVVTTLADSQRGMQTSGRSRDSRAGIYFDSNFRGPNLKWATTP